MAAAAIVACDPVLLWQSRFVMTETLGAFLTALAFVTLAQSRWRGAIAGGVCLGLAGLCRPSLLPGAGLIVLGSLAPGPGHRREQAARSLAMAVSMAAVLAPWAIRNALVFGEPVVTTTHGGYTLALANNESYYRDVLAGSPGRVWTGTDQWLWWDSVNRATAGMSEPQADRFLRGTVVRLAIDQPATFLRACLDRLHPVLERGSGRGRLFSARAPGHGSLDRSTLDRPGSGSLPARARGAGPRSPPPWRLLGSAWFTPCTGPISGCGRPSSRRLRWSRHRP